MGVKKFIFKYNLVYIQKFTISFQDVSVSSVAGMSPSAGNPRRHLSSSPTTGQASTNQTAPRHNATNSRITMRAHLRTELWRLLALRSCRSGWSQCARAWRPRCCTTRTWRPDVRTACNVPPGSLKTRSLGERSGVTMDQCFAAWFRWTTGIP